MDDYRDLGIAGLAVLCASLMLVAGLLFILGSTDGSKPAEIGPPSPQIAASSPLEMAPAKHRSIANFR
ncbi:MULTISPECIES: hypothetical protein [Bradyrhizobium]|jgi:hypothetical protein|uniref:hypothetical protein n=1 Tax=Bradyrhizobium TaxID=374 RepID=UPI00057113AC|nr:hypothetical protein [Bradyrhizobium elkanii]MCS3520175.1 hypothetical protein [Bradyrhizobium elkanii]MCS4067830.1 hypothetical protein [Bradyrhizobium elkanii]MCS4083366.1 hypothetical protein [Bradyrhizobium elkanii]MCW2127007.1 hypothetical protein [Bradyrhizobium elkanii]MCW2173754.1 hypothetical protein [Bradyrhizobium elkanii]